MIESIIARINEKGIISDEVIHQVQTDQQVRVELIKYFRSNFNRAAAVLLLKTFIRVREQPEGNMPVEDLMLASYILGLHKQIDNILLIWKAKNVDFDTYCGLDIQLMVFVGVDETISYLKEQTTSEGKNAYQYLKNCKNAGDFDDIDEYFSKEKMPWFV